jgi:adenylate cyclase
LIREQRRLAAIMSADVLGYSRLMSRDESGTLRRLKAHRTACVEPVLARNSGRIVKLMGDGLLAEFASAVDALRAAIQLQQAIADDNARNAAADPIVLRIGLHLGDLLVEGDDLYGDAVNVAARLETEAPPGGVLISSAVHDAVSGKLPLTLQDVGELNLKNIDRPVRAFRAEWEPARWSLAASGHAGTGPVALSRDAALPLPDRPSIAVLPFQNMSGDIEQEYFVDGLVEDIITGLSRFRQLFVIARNSTFTYKGRTVDVKDVGRELGVRYVLEGSIRKAANRVRITGQLIDASTGAHIWADRFDGSLEDVFTLQDQITSTVVGTIGPQIERAEMERVRRNPTANLHAYDYFLRGLAVINSGRLRGAEEIVATAHEALALFFKAIELDQEYGLAYGMAAQCYTMENQVGVRENRQEFVRNATHLARRAMEFGRDDAAVLCRAGQAFAYVAGEVEAGAALLDRAILINPNLALAWNMGGWTKIFLGEPEAAIERMATAMRLNPLDPTLFLMQAGTACGHLFAGRYAEAAIWAERALAERPLMPLALRIAASSFALAGRTQEARELIAKTLRASPGVRLSHVRDMFPLRRASDLETYTDGLRRAGLPD